jgi:endonuclease/exonuclease/phosphatase family metal-dependent hydrolase
LQILSRRTLWGARLCFLFFLLLVVAASHGCAGSHALVARNTAELAQSDPARIVWFGPAHGEDGAALARWRKSVGPPRVLGAAQPAQPNADSLRIVSWNTAVGDGNIVALVRTLSASGGPLVLLLQEVYREGPEVPAEAAPDWSFAGRLGKDEPARTDGDIEDTARMLGMALYYVPSMRNGGAPSDEDRGNAILSNVPLRDLRAIELPFERQRRVAIAATVSGVTRTGAPWSVRLVSAHLDNLGGMKRAWVAAEYGRARQARALAGLLQDSEPTVLAGDFNTWFGFSDGAYRETARLFPSTRISDRRPTFRGLLRLDHMFSRLPSGWQMEFHRGSSRFGSDHYPLLGTLRLN